MRHVKTFCAVTCATVLLVAGDASAQVADRTTQLTFNTPVELPGKTLPAGTYTFRLAAPEGERNVINVLDAKGETHVITLYSMPSRRVHRAEDTVVTFHELPSNATPAIRFWYYPGDPMGHEFAYPKDRAQLIANATGESVLAIEDETVMHVEPAPEVATPATPVEERVETPAPTTPEPVGTSGRRRLPQTSSSLPLTGLLGLIALGGGLTMRALRLGRH